MFDARQTCFELGGQRMHQLVFGNTDRLVRVTESVLGDDAIPSPTEKEPDGGGIGLAPQLRIDATQIEVELTGVLGTAFAGLELDDHEAPQVKVIE